MKTFIVLIAAFLLFSVNTYGQWIRNYSLPDTLGSYSVSFYEEGTGFLCVTNPGRLLKTLDEAQTWTEVNIPNALPVICYVKITDQKKLWLVMNQSPLLTGYANVSMSEDLGTTWDLKFETNYSIRDLFMLDENHMWVGTLYQRVYASHDGGETWQESEATPMARVNDLFFVNPDTGWAAGGTASDMIMKTTDGGYSWEVQFERYNSYGSFNHIEFVNSQKGFCIGRDRLMLKTTDGGDTWEYVSGEFGAPCAQLGDLPSNASILDIEFIDENRGWIVGGLGGCPQPPGHFIMSTIDGGDTWQMDMINDYLPYYELNAVVFDDGIHGWASGHDGLLFSYDIMAVVKNVTENQNLKIYPNPSKDHVVISSDEAIGTISLCNQFGQMLYKEEGVNSKEVKLDLWDYPGGLYIIRIDNMYHKIIKI